MTGIYLLLMAFFLQKTLLIVTQANNVCTAGLLWARYIIRIMYRTLKPTVPSGSSPYCAAELPGVDTDSCPLPFQDP